MNVLFKSKCDKIQVSVDAYMAKIDIPSKRLIQIRPEDWVKLLVPDCKSEWISEMKTEKVPKIESRLDSLFWVESPDGPYILNIEPQGYKDKAMPARMLRYRADIWEYTMSKDKSTPRINQAVIFYFPEHDNERNTLNDDWQGKLTIDYNYDVIKVWELKKDIIINQKLYGLYPLLPLMQIEEKEIPEDIIKKAVDAIETVEDTHLKADLLVAMSILAGYKFSNILVKKYIRRETLMESSLYNEWMEEERKEAAIAIAMATTATTQRNIIELLAERFDIVPKKTRENIEEIKDMVILNELFRKSIRVSTIEDFQTILDKAIKNK